MNDIFPTCPHEDCTEAARHWHCPTGLHVCDAPHCDDIYGPGKPEGCVAPRPATPTPVDPTPIDPADLRVGDRVRVDWAPTEGRVVRYERDPGMAPWVDIVTDDGDGASLRGDGTQRIYLLDRPEPEDPGIKAAREWLRDAGANINGANPSTLLAAIDAARGAES